MRNFNLGVRHIDIALFALAALAGVVLVIVWHLTLVDWVGSFWRGNEQRINKYVLTLVLYGLAFGVAIVSLGLAHVRGPRPGLAALLPGFLVRFGLALQILGILIVPIALWYAADPTRSVPIGFTSFSMVFIGVFIAGFGGNMIAPR